MILHSHLGNTSYSRSKNLLKQIQNGTIQLGGNRQLKIYGRLDCASGKRMKMDNRVFFKNKEDAVKNGYRPCGHCLKQEYDQWKLMNEK